MEWAILKHLARDGMGVIPNPGRADLPGRLPPFFAPLCPISIAHTRLLPGPGRQTGRFALPIEGRADLLGRLPPFFAPPFPSRSHTPVCCQAPEGKPAGLPYQLKVGRPCRAAFPLSSPRLSHLDRTRQVVAKPRKANRQVALPIKDRAALLRRLPFFILFKPSALD